MWPSGLHYLKQFRSFPCERLSKDFCTYLKPTLYLDTTLAKFHLDSPLPRRVVSGSGFAIALIRHGGATLPRTSQARPFQAPLA